MDGLIFVTIHYHYGIFDNFQKRIMENDKNVAKLEEWADKLANEVGEDKKVTVICCAGNGTKSLANTIVDTFPLTKIHFEDGLNFSKENIEAKNRLEKAIIRYGEDTDVVIVIAANDASCIPKSFRDIAKNLEMEERDVYYDAKLSWTREAKISYNLPP